MFPGISRRNGWLPIAAGLAWCWAVALAVAGAPIGDEWVHWTQVQRFVHGDFRIYDQWLTNIPGYHWMVTALLWPFGTDALGAVRLVSALMFGGCALVFWRVRALLHPADAWRATTLFFFLPTLFVYGFQAYTDVPALLFLLLALWNTVQGRHRASALALLASMAMRQNNVLWVVFLGVFAAWPLVFPASPSVMAPAFWRRCLRWACWRAVLARVWPYLLAVAAFCAYWAWNGSIAWSTAQSENAHPDFRPDIGNPVLLMACIGVLFPFQMACGWRRLWEFGARGRGVWIWLVPVVAFGLYAWLFQVHHPFNFIVESNLRNQWLQRVAGGGWAWWSFGVLVAWAAGGLAFTRYVVQPGALWLPFSLAFVGASWMIETRYTIVPLVLFLALRRPEADWMERVTLMAWGVLSLWLLWEVMGQHFML